MKTSASSFGRDRSLEDVHSSVHTGHPSFWKRLFAFTGPAYMVSVGYMDPGNWATDIEGGSRFGYSLLWVLLMSNVIALLLQTLSARLGIVAGRDLAQACRDLYAKPVRIALWLFCEVAIAACDLAEVIGTVIGLHLLFGLPFGWGLGVTILDTFLLLAIQRLGIRKMEAFIVSLVFTIGACFLLEIVLAEPQWSAVLAGFVPHVSMKAPFVFSDISALYVAIGILGATVMPHNLYLHSALVQSRSVKRTTEGMREACTFNLIDSFLALNAAFLVNAAILVLAAAAFGMNGQVVAGIEEAHRLLPQFLGPELAATLFAIALLCSGQSSTLTGTLAGQIVMEGFISFRMQPWLRRFITRAIAILPAAATLYFFGAGKLQDLLVLSQVVLSLQLPFAVLPLIRYTSSKEKMGAFSNPLWVKIAGGVIAAIIISLNAYLAANQILSWFGFVEEAGYSTLWLWFTVVPFVIGCAGLLVWVIVEPFFTSKYAAARAVNSATDVANSLSIPKFTRIAVAVENTKEDAKALSHAAALAKAHAAELVLIHVVDGVGAQWYGDEAKDEEQVSDQSYVETLVSELQKKGVAARGLLRYGTPAQELASAIKDERADLVVLRAHGHGFLADRFLGHTIDTLRHALEIPVLVVRDAD